MKVQKYRSCSLPFCRERKRPGRVMFTYLAVLAMVALPYAAMGQGETKPPNILALFGDDIGWFNLSIYHHGMMGYKTPNIDSIGKQGAMFTDAYAEQSCTAGRAAFLTGQHGLRTGMLKVGMPGLPFGLSHQDPTLAQYLKSKDYATGQFGKNHLGDDDHTLPTTHGFDEFFGNLYHLNAEEEPEHPDYPKDPAFSENFGPRGVLHSFAPGQYENLDDVPQYLIDNEGNDLVHYIVGQEGDPNLGDRDPMDDDDKKPGDGQLVIDTGHLTTERMKVIDGAFTREAIRFMGNIIKQDDAPPFFVWYATSRMHTWTHLKKENELPTEIPAFDRLCYTPNSTSGFETYSEPDGSAKKEGDLCNEAFGQKDGAPYYAEGQTGLGTYPDGMVEHDYYIGMLLKFLEDNKIENNTIVIYSSDNGPQFFTWPDGGTTPFRSEKNSNWEGAYRVPLLVRWPGLIEPGYISNDIIALQDWFPTLASAVSEAAGNREDIKELLKAGDHKLDDQNDSNDVANDDDTYRAHLDGYDFYDHWKSCAKAAYFNIEIDKLPEECQQARAENTSTAMTMASWSVCASMSGRLSSMNNAQRVLTSGRIRSLPCGPRSSSTCVGIRLSELTRSQTTTVSGVLTTCSCSLQASFRSISS